MGRIEKAKELTNAKIQFVSLVNKGANGCTFLISKSDGNASTWISTSQIIDKEADKHYVTGIVYEPQTEDTHGHFMNAEEIEKASHWYSKNANKIDIQHDYKEFKNASVVENWIAKADFELNGNQVKKGTWLMTVEIQDDDVWEKIEKGEITGFSMGGTANISEKEFELKKISKSEKQNVLSQLAEMLGVVENVEKGEVAETYKIKKLAEDFNNAQEVFRKSIFGTYDNPKSASDEEIKTAIDDYTKILKDIFKIANAEDENIEKAGRKMSKGNFAKLEKLYLDLGNFIKDFQDDVEIEKEESEDEMTRDEVKAMIDEAVKVKLKEEEPKEEEKKVEKEEEEETINKADVEEMIKQELATILKAKGLPSNLNSEETKQIEKEDKHYLAGIL